MSPPTSTKRTLEEGESLLEGVKALVLDIEGTITPISFVKVNICSHCHYNHMWWKSARGSLSKYIFFGYYVCLFLHCVQVMLQSWFVRTGDACNTGCQSLIANLQLLLIWCCWCLWWGVVSKLYVGINWCLYFYTFYYYLTSLLVFMTLLLYLFLYFVILPLMLVFKDKNE